MFGIILALLLSYSAHASDPFDRVFDYAKPAAKKRDKSLESKLWDIHYQARRGVLRYAAPGWGCSPYSFKVQRKARGLHRLAVHYGTAPSGRKHMWTCGKKYCLEINNGVVLRSEFHRLGYTYEKSLSR